MRVRHALFACLLVPGNAFTPAARSPPGVRGAPSVCTVARAQGQAAVRMIAHDPEPPAPLYTKLLVADAGVLAVYSLTNSCFKSLFLAGSDLTSPDFNLVADITSFDPLATVQYIGAEQFGAACLAAGWVVGGSVFGACSTSWSTIDPDEQLMRLVRSWALAAPLACLLKYSVFAQVDLPSLGQSTAAIALQAQLSGVTAANVATDILGMLGVLLLWRRFLLQNPFLMP